MAQTDDAGNGKSAPERTMEDQRADLLNDGLHRLRQQKPVIESAKAVVTKAKAELSEAQEEYNSIIDQIKGDTRLTREQIEQALKFSEGGARSLVNHLRGVSFICKALGVPFQQELLDDGDKLPDEAKDELFWEAEGYLLGRRGAEPELPEGVSPRFLQPLMNGWHEGQEATGKMLVRAAAIRAEREKPNVEPATEIDDSAEIDPDQVEEQAEALKRKGFTKKAEASAEVVAH